MKNFIFLFVLLFTISCQQSTSTTPPVLGEEFDIKFGQSLMVAHENINIEFEEVEEDSRCPKNAECIWAGNAHILVRLNDQKADLNTYTGPEEHKITDYQIELVELSPYPELDKEIKKEDYVARLLITER